MKFSSKEEWYRYLDKLDNKNWKCPLKQKDCKRNCGNYGCGN